MKSQITTMEQLLALDDNQKVYIPHVNGVKTVVGPCLASFNNPGSTLFTEPLDAFKYHEKLKGLKNTLS